LPTYRKTSPGPSLQKLVLADPLLTAKLYRLVRSRPIDLIHSHHYEGLLIGSAVARLTKHPVVYDAHTLLQDELPCYPFGLPTSLISGLGRRLDRALPKLADHAIAVTSRIRQQLVEEAGLPPAAVTTIGNAIDLLEDGLGAEHSGIDRSERENGHKGRVLVFAGNLAPYQGVDLLLKCFAPIARRYPDVRLLILSNDSFSPYRTLAARLGVLERIDVVAVEVPDLVRMLSSADVAVNPRPAAPGLPVKILNYMLAGLPVVSFEGSTGGLVEHEKTGWVVPGTDVNAFADGIAGLLDRPREARKFGETARLHVLSLGSWADKARAIEQVYERVLATYPRAS